MLTLAIDASHLLTVAPPPEAARRGVALFTLLAFSGLMLVLLAGVLAIMGARRRRARTPDATARTPGPRIDPWTESARRLHHADADDQG